MNPAQLTTSTQPPTEEVRDRLSEFHELLTAAAADAHTSQDTANQAENALALEGERRQTLVADTNRRLGT